MNPSVKPGRVELLDAWRASAVIVMVFWHLCWDLTMYGTLPARVMFEQPMLGIRYYIICSFVLLSGISCRFSRSNARRGLQTLLCAAAVTLVMYIIGDPVWFGVLHLLGCCMLLYAWLGKYFEKLPDLPAALGCTALFLILHRICYGTYVTVPWLWMFGLRTREFYSSDYYPLFPWLFLFLTGTALGGRIRASDGEWKKVRLPAPLGWIGRHALLIYMLHQPALMGILYLVYRRFP